MQGDLQLVVFVGIQGSGKSEFYKDRFIKSHYLVSKDLMGRRKKKEVRQQRWVREALAGGRSVVVDNTNPDVESRQDLIKLAREYGACTLAYVFMTPVEQCLRRNEAREPPWRVPLVGVYATLKRLKAPSYQEGFDEIYEVRSAPEPQKWEVRRQPHPGSP